jgi:hypothetical protein
LQTITISGYEGGRYALILQGLVVTTSFDLSSSSSTIATEMGTKVMTLPYAMRECSSFNVIKRVTGNTLTLRIQFNTDNANPLSLLEVYTSDIIGKSLKIPIVVALHTIGTHVSLSLSLSLSLLLA